MKVDGEKKCSCAYQRWGMAAIGGVMIIASAGGGYFWGWRKSVEECVNGAYERGLYDAVHSTVYPMKRYETVGESIQNEGEEEKEECYAVLKEWTKEQDAWRWAEKMMETYTVPLYVRTDGQGKRKRYRVVTGWMEKKELEELVTMMTKKDVIAAVEIMTRDTDERK